MVTALVLLHVYNAASLPSCTDSYFEVISAIHVPTMTIV